MLGPVGSLVTRDLYQPINLGSNSRHDHQKGRPSADAPLGVDSFPAV
jgi:hypothetical protein